MKNEPTPKTLSWDQAKPNISPAGFTHSAAANQATKYVINKHLLSFLPDHFSRQEFKHKQLFNDLKALFHTPALSHISVVAWYT